MSMETSIVFSLALPAFALIYLASKMGENSARSHSVIRMFMVGISQWYIVAIPFIGWKIASNAGKVYASWLLYIGLAGVVFSVVFTFYLIWLYIQDTGKAMSKAEEEFNGDFM